MSIESVMPSSHLILFRPLLFLPPIPPSIRVFSDESTLHIRWPKYWSFTTQYKKPKQPNQETSEHWIDIFPKKTYRWLTCTWKDAQNFYLLEKCKSKWVITSHVSDWLSSESLQITRVGDMEKRELLYTIGGNVNWCKHYGKWYEDSLKTKK